MKIDKVGQYRTSNGQRVDISTIFAGSAYGYVVTECGATFWRAEDGSHPTRADLQIVSEWVATKQQDDDLRLIVARTLGRLQGLQRYRMESDDKSQAMTADAIDGDWLAADEMLTAIEDLRRAIGDCTLDQEAR
jgi:hypothetical protein